MGLADGSASRRTTSANPGKYLSCIGIPDGPAMVGEMKAKLGSLGSPGSEFSAIHADSIKSPFWDAQLGISAESCSRVYEMVPQVVHPALGPEPGEHSEY
jgi:hypothetical protein